MSIDITINGTDYPVPSSAADVNWAADQVAFEQALAAYANALGVDLTELTASVGVPTWTGLTLVNSWADSGGSEQPSQRTKSFAGWVTLRGALHSGADGVVCTTLPAGWRPGKLQRFLVYASGGPAQVDIDTDGTVTPRDIGGSSVNTLVSLAGVSFSTTA